LTNPDDALVEPSVAASAAAATSPGPPPSSDAPETIKEPLGQPGPDTERPDQEAIAEPAAFDARCREPFTGLMFLGHLEQTVSIWGHTFRLVTPSQAMKLQLGPLHKPFLNTLATDIAYQTILVAAYLRQVDHRELPQPVLNDPTENALADRFRWVGENLRQPVIDRLFSICLEMEGQVSSVLRAMGEAQG
jgi:hypothetical protein